MTTTYNNVFLTPMTLPSGNWAFIDMQNLFKGIQEKGWQINWNYFREYLYEQFNVVNAIAFMGYIREYEGLYRTLRNGGFQLEFREVKRLANGMIDGGNVDADLASFLMDHKYEYNKAVIVADDGDYCRTIQSLDRQNKLMKILSSHSFYSTSELIKRSVNLDYILSIHAIRHLIGTQDFQ